MPLVKKLGGKCKIIAYDLSVGSYEGDLEILRKKVLAKGLESVVEVVEGDVRNIKSIADGSVGLVISNELLCELDRVGLEQVLREFIAF